MSDQFRGFFFFAKSRSLFYKRYFKWSRHIKLQIERSLKDTDIYRIHIVLWHKKHNIAKQLFSDLKKEKQTIVKEKDTEIFN